MSGGVALSGVAFGGLRYFAARGPTDDDIELWRTDGTLAGSARVADVRPGPDASSLGLAVASGLLWFSADDGSTGREPWMSDGTGAGIIRVADANPGAAGSDPRSSRGSDRPCSSPRPMAARVASFG